MKRGLLFLILVGCGDGKTPSVDAPVTPPIDSELADAPIDANPLETLAGTGLCLDAACTQIDPAVREYRPRFELWADTATKRRWIFLPAGSQIDTSNMDRWVFPVGTKLWKEFTRDGTRVETRMIMKVLADDDAPGAWFFATYQWNATQDDTTAVTAGVQDANGTGHDIPSRAQCHECHDGVRPTRVLGFGAIQLDDGALPFSLDDAIAANLLSAPPAGTSPHFPIPGTASERAALTYLHANCGHCHNPTSQTHDVAPMEVLLDTTKLASVQTTPTFLTTVNVDAAVPYTEDGTTYTKIIIPGDLANSALLARTTSNQSIRRMPKLGAEMIDPAGQTALRTWVNSL
ncbi:MAG TPA: hypothetical protein VFQ53_02335 [Kofleriaceae bacterium]|nr:hypothetical protein [Kofleriaceae bacterium]